MRAITLLSNSNVQATCNISLAVFEQELSSVMIPEHLKILADSPNFIAVFANVKSMLEAYLTNDHSFAKASEEMPLVADPGTPAIDVAQRQQEPPDVAEAPTPITGFRRHPASACPSQSDNDLSRACTAMEIRGPRETPKFLVDKPLEVRVYTPAGS